METKQMEYSELSETEDEAEAFSGFVVEDQDSTISSLERIESVYNRVYGTDNQIRSNCQPARASTSTPTLPQDCDADSQRSFSPELGTSNSFSYVPLSATKTGGHCKDENSNELHANSFAEESNSDVNTPESISLSKLGIPNKRAVILFNSKTLDTLNTVAACDVSPTALALQSKTSLFSSSAPPPAPDRPWFSPQPDEPLEFYLGRMDLLLNKVGAKMPLRSDLERYRMCDIYGNQCSNNSVFVAEPNQQHSGSPVLNGVESNDGLQTLSKSNFISQSTPKRGTSLGSSRTTDSDQSLSNENLKSKAFCSKFHFQPRPHNAQLKDTLKEWCSPTKIVSPVVVVDSNIDINEAATASNDTALVLTFNCNPGVGETKDLSPCMEKAALFQPKVYIEPLSPEVLEKNGIKTSTTTPSKVPSHPATGLRERRNVAPMSYSLLLKKGLCTDSKNSASKSLSQFLYTKNSSEPVAKSLCIVPAEIGKSPSSQENHISSKSSSDDVMIAEEVIESACAEERALLLAIKTPEVESASSACFSSESTTIASNLAATEHSALNSSLTKHSFENAICSPSASDKLCGPPAVKRRNTNTPPPVTADNMEKSSFLNDDSSSSSTVEPRKPTREAKLNWKTRLEQRRIFGDAPVSSPRSLSCWQRDLNKQKRTASASSSGITDSSPGFLNTCSAMKTNASHERLTQFLPTCSPTVGSKAWFMYKYVRFTNQRGVVFEDYDGLEKALGNFVVQNETSLKHHAPRLSSALGSSKKSPLLSPRKVNSERNNHSNKTAARKSPPVANGLPKSPPLSPLRHAKHPFDIIVHKLKNKTKLSPNNSLHTPSVSTVLSAHLSPPKSFKCEEIKKSPKKSPKATESDTGGCNIRIENVFSLSTAATRGSSTQNNWPPWWLQKNVKKPCFVSRILTEMEINTSIAPVCLPDASASVISAIASSSPPQPPIVIAHSSSSFNTENSETACVYNESTSQSRCTELVNLKQTHCAGCSASSDSVKLFPSPYVSKLVLCSNCLEPFELWNTQRKHCLQKYRCSKGALCTFPTKQFCESCWFWRCVNVVRWSLPRPINDELQNKDQVTSKSKTKSSARSSNLVNPTGSLKHLGTRSNSRSKKRMTCGKSTNIADRRESPQHDDGALKVNEAPETSTANASSSEAPMECDTKQVAQKHLHDFNNLKQCVKTENLFGETVDIKPADTQSALHPRVKHVSRRPPSGLPLARFPASSPVDLCYSVQLSALPDDERDLIIKEELDREKDEIPIITTLSSRPKGKSAGKSGKGKSSKAKMSPYFGDTTFSVDMTTHDFSAVLNGDSFCNGSPSKRSRTYTVSGVVREAECQRYPLGRKLSMESDVTMRDL